MMLLRLQVTSATRLGLITELVAPLFVFGSKSKSSKALYWVLRKLYRTEINGEQKYYFILWRATCTRKFLHTVSPSEVTDWYDEFSDFTNLSAAAQVLHIFMLKLHIISASYMITSKSAWLGDIFTVNSVPLYFFHWMCSTQKIRHTSHLFHCGLSVD